jgi:hypothetical protein
MNTKFSWPKLGMSIAAVVGMLALTPPAQSASKKPAPKAKMSAFYIRVSGTQTQTWQSSYSYVKAACPVTERWSVLADGSSTIKFETIGAGQLLAGFLYTLPTGEPALDMQGPLTVTNTVDGNHVETRMQGCQRGPSEYTDAKTGCGTATKRLLFGNGLLLGPPHANLIYLESYDLIPRPEGPCPDRMSYTLPMFDKRVNTCKEIVGMENAPDSLSGRVLGLNGPLDQAKFRAARKPFTEHFTQKLECAVGLKAEGLEPPDATVTLRMAFDVDFTFYPGTKCGYDICLFQPLPKTI